MPINLRALSMVLVLAGIITSPVYAATQADNATEQLLRGAKKWVDKDRSDLAQGMLKKVLLIEPTSPEALSMLGQIELKNGKPEEGLRYLRTLEQTAPNNPHTSELANAYRLTTGKKATFEKPGVPTKTSKPAQTDKYAERLSELEAQSSDPKQLTATLGGYEELSQHAGVNTQRLQKDWRHSLNKLSDKADKQAAIKRFLKIYPDDTEMIALLGNVQKNRAEQSVLSKNKVSNKTQNKQAIANKNKPENQAKNKQPEATTSLTIDPYITARTDALDALDDEKLEIAEPALLDLLKLKPLDSEVLGGLGLLNQKRGKYAEAEDMFEQALKTAQEGKKDFSRWESLIGTAKFSQHMTNAKSLLNQNKLLEAETEIQQAQLAKPQDPDTLAILGNIKAAAGENTEAERLYHESLKIEPFNVFATRGLATLLARTNRSEEALNLIEQVLRDFQSEWGKAPDSQASLLRETAKLYVESHRTSHAMDALEKAVKINPTNPWVRFSLAKLYISLNLAPLGKQVMQEGISLSPHDPEMHYTQALVLLGLNDYAGGLDSLNQIPEASLTQDMRNTKKNALMKYYFQLATNKLDQGNRKETIRIMSVAETQALGDFSATEQVAEGWFKLGLQKQGLNAMRKLPQPTPLSTQVYFASLLNRAKKDQELTELLPTLQLPDGSDDSSKKYRATIQDIELAMAGRQFDGLMKAGKKEQAQQLADRVLDAAQLSTADYFKYHRSYFSRADLPENAIPLLEQEKEQFPNDLNLRYDLAYAYHQDKLNDNARRELQELLTLTKGDDIDMRMRIANLQQSVGDNSGAQVTIDDLTDRYPNNTDLLLQAARMAQSNGQYNRAMSYYSQTKAEAGKPATPNAPAAAVVQTEQPDVLLNLLPGKTSNSVSHTPTTMHASPILASTPESDKIYRAVLASDVSKDKYVPDNNAAIAEKQMNDIASSRSAQIEAGIDIQSKTSNSGTSTYNATEIPVMVRFPIGFDAHGMVQVDQVNIDAGALPSTFANAALFGQVQAAQFVPAQPLTPKASGTSVAVGYEQDSVKADIGMVGSNFPVSNIVGGIRHGGDFGKLSYSLNLSRRPYTGSLLSYAGAKDPVTGTVWGGVTNTGLSLYLSTTLNTFNVAGVASYGLLRGQNVLNNDRIYLRAAVDHDIYTSDDTVLNVGLNVNYTSFSKNEAFYTFGHGGYYSPQSSLTFGFPIELYGRADLLSYQLKASITYSRSNEDAAAFYPTNPALQASANAGPNFPSGYTQALYAGGTGGGIGYGLRGATEYRLTPNFALGGRFSMDRSAYYAPNSLLMYMRYMFNPETGPVKMRPDPVTPYSQY